MANPSMHTCISFLKYNNANQHLFSLLELHAEYKAVTLRLCRAVRLKSRTWCGVSGQDGTKLSLSCAGQPRAGRAYTEDIGFYKYSKVRTLRYIQ